MGKILLYENMVTYFLRRTIHYLTEWKKLPDIEKMTHNIYIDCLEELFEEVVEELPDYCYGILGLVNTILYEEKIWKNKIKLINQTIHLCDLLLAKASVETFEWLVDYNYSTLAVDERFSEDILEDVLKKVFRLQLKYESARKNKKTRAKQKYYREKLKENTLLWIALVRMNNITEKILLKTIRYAHFDSWGFYRFCLEIAGNPRTTEKVWLALIQRIHSENFERFSIKQSQIRKTRIIVSMFQICYPSATVVKKAIELIDPVGKYYYDFYIGIILKHRSDKEILSEIRKKFIPENINKIIQTGYQGKRLQLLLNNLP